MLGGQILGTQAKYSRIRTERNAEFGADAGLLCFDACQRPAGYILDTYRICPGTAVRTLSPDRTPFGFCPPYGVASQTPVFNKKTGFCVPAQC